MSGAPHQLLGGFLQDPSLLLGIPLALAGAFCMSLGAQYQHAGVEKVERSGGVRSAHGLSFAHLRSLFTRPSWILGTLLLGLAVVCQLGAISVAPLMVVQPLGVVALLLTTILNARASGIPPTRRSWIAIGACIVGIAIFVVLAARYASKRPATDTDVLTILVTLLVVTVCILAVWAILRKRVRALFHVVAAGIVYGFVATLAKVIIDRLQQAQFDGLVVLCAVALLATATLGGYFVQSAYSSGPPDLVVAGLTVVDPLVAVLIAMLILGEAAASPPWTVPIFVVAGAIAVGGVFGLARHHPQARATSDPEPEAPDPTHIGRTGTKPNTAG